MWQRALFYLVLANIRSLNVYREAKSPSSLQNEVFLYLKNAIQQLNWHYRWGVQFLLSMQVLFCYLRFFKSLEHLDDETRESFFKALKRMPGFGTLEKLVRSLSLIRVYDPVAV